jgi:hypothetical protein
VTSVSLLRTILITRERSVLSGNPFALVGATDVAFVSRETFRDYFISRSEVASREREGELKNIFRIIISFRVRSAASSRRFSRWKSNSRD